VQAEGHRAGIQRPLSGIRGGKPEKRVQPGVEASKKECWSREGGVCLMGGSYKGLVNNGGRMERGTLRRG